VLLIVIRVGVIPFYVLPVGFSLPLLVVRRLRRGVGASKSLMHPEIGIGSRGKGVL
jgi:hypothetical protein